MSGAPDTLCFTCGQPVTDPPRFNHLANGRPCPTCRDRLLESLPSLLPSRSGERAEVEEDEIEEQPAWAPRDRGGSR